MDVLSAALAELGQALLWAWLWLEDGHRVVTGVVEDLFSSFC